MERAEKALADGAWLLHKFSKILFLLLPLKPWRKSFFLNMIYSVMSMKALMRISICFQFTINFLNRLYCFLEIYLYYLNCYVFIVWCLLVIPHHQFRLRLLIFWGQFQSITSAQVLQPKVQSWFYSPKCFKLQATSLFLLPLQTPALHLQNRFER